MRTETVSSEFNQSTVWTMSSTSFVPVSSLRTSSRFSVKVTTLPSTPISASVSSGGWGMLFHPPINAPRQVPPVQQDACIENADPFWVCEDGIEVELRDLRKRE